jgi:hypothetical protein
MVVGLKRRRGANLFEVDEKEVLEWGKKMYPGIQNKNILMQLYLKNVKGKDIDPRTLAVYGPVKNIADLRPGEWVVIEGLVGVSIRPVTYKGCPQCLRSVDGPLCPECGVAPVQLTWEHYLIGDNTGEVPLTVPPRFTGINYEGKVIRVRGTLRDSGEFVAQAIQIVGPKGGEAPKQASSVVPEEVRALKQLLQVYPKVTMAELKTWHAARKFKTPLDDLIEAVGAKRDGDTICSTS